MQNVATSADQTFRQKGYGPTSDLGSELWTCTWKLSSACLLHFTAAWTRFNQTIVNFFPWLSRGGNRGINTHLS